MPRPCLLRLHRVPAVVPGFVVACRDTVGSVQPGRRPTGRPAGPAAGPAARRCHLQGVRMVPQGSSFTTRPQLAGTFGMVASTHWLASAAGLAVLEAGGNAFDAAVAAGLVLQVVEPHLNGPGGEVPVVGFDASDGEIFVLNGQGPAPRAATIEAFGELGLDLVPGNGLLAPCVPAAFGTWMLLLAAHGRLRLREVMHYAIGYAAGGYPV